MSCLLKKYINLFIISTQKHRWYDPMGHYNAGEIKDNLHDCSILAM